MSRTTVQMPDELLAEAHAHAARTGRSFAQLMADALRHELQRPAIARHICDPLPTYGGNGLQPGVDLSSNRALLDDMVTPMKDEL